MKQTNWQTNWLNDVLKCSICKVHDKGMVLTLCPQHYKELKESRKRLEV